MMNPYKILDIEATKDKKLIKRAYSKKVAQFHPEEHPEEFRQIVEAYQLAMQYADGDDSYNNYESYSEKNYHYAEYHQQAPLNEDLFNEEVAEEIDNKNAKILQDEAGAVGADFVKLVDIGSKAGVKMFFTSKESDRFRRVRRNLYFLQGLHKLINEDGVKWLDLEIVEIMEKAFTPDQSEVLDDEVRIQLHAILITLNRQRGTADKNTKKISRKLKKWAIGFVIVFAIMATVIDFVNYNYNANNDTEQDIVINIPELLPRPMPSPADEIYDMVTLFVPQMIRDIVEEDPEQLTYLEQSLLMSAIEFLSESSGLNLQTAHSFDFSQGLVETTVPMVFYSIDDHTIYALVEVEVVFRD